MNVGVFLQGNPDVPGIADYLRMGKLTVESVHDAMPGVPVVHFTDGTTPMIEGADDVRRIDVKLPMAVRRMMHNGNSEGDWLFIDCDVIVQKDVRDVFQEDFDVALTDRLGTITNEAEYAKVMPFNLGVSFSRNTKFWRRVLYHMQTISPKLQQWTGDQLVICEMIRQKAASDFKIRTLPGLTYNYPPRSEDDPRAKNAALVHWKGPRKAWLLKEAA